MQFFHGSRVPVLLLLGVGGCASAPAAAGPAVGGTLDAGAIRSTVVTHAPIDVRYHGLAQTGFGPARVLPIYAPGNADKIAAALAEAIDDPIQRF